MCVLRKSLLQEGNVSIRDENCSWLRVKPTRRQVMGQQRRLLSSSWVIYARPLCFPHQNPTVVSSSYYLSKVVSQRK